MKNISTLLIGLILSLNFIAAADPYYNCGMFGGMMGYYGLGGGIFSWIVYILIVVALILFIIWMIKKINKK